MLVRSPSREARPPLIAEVNWLPAIDGLRAVAIIAVLIHHANTAALQDWALGNAGVALFFSISGFLAYFVLWKDDQRLGKINYNYFLLRRILRIWPAYIAVITLAVCLATPEQRAATSQIPLFTFTANWHQAAMMKPALSTLGVLWSIAVEEQFYLLAPFMYLALRSRQWLAFSTAIIVMSNAGRLIYITYFASSAPYTGLYFITYSYADIFLGGALAAKWFTEGGTLSKTVQCWLSITAAAVIIATLRFWGPIVWAPYSPWTLLPYPLLAVAGPLLLVSVAISSETFLGAVLASKPLRFIGRLSYSLYLLHVLIITKLLDLFGMTFGGFWFYLCFAGLCLPLASALHYGVERPFLQLKSHVKATAVPWPAALIWSLMMIGTIRFFVAN
ncbi:acyltransferase family protein [Bradyrhizobium liaoningense]|uniref:acyltransferase family protein n=1 Tax=Bradyrhizobium liaoningense TaxID=43992 RepID=UPI0024E109E8|nr:acyltransferase [Bradyrhizobium liaoningense]